MPYNYLIDEKIRENYEISYANSVIIIDEAHNIAPATEEISSFQIKAKTLEQILTELDDLKDYFAHETKDLKSQVDGIGYIR